MPYIKRSEKCKNAAGMPGTFVTVKKDGGKRQCWKSEAAFERAQAARHAQAESRDVKAIMESWRQYLEKSTVNSQPQPYPSQIET